MRKEFSTFIPLNIEALAFITNEDPVKITLEFDGELFENGIPEAMPGNWPVEAKAVVKFRDGQRVYFYVYFGNIPIAEERVNYDGTVTPGETVYAIRLEINDMKFLVTNGLPVNRVDEFFDAE